MTRMAFFFLAEVYPRHPDVPKALVRVKQKLKWHLCPRGEGPCCPAGGVFSFYPCEKSVPLPSRKPRGVLFGLQNSIDSFPGVYTVFKGCYGITKSSHVLSRTKGQKSSSRSWRSRSRDILSLTFRAVYNRKTTTLKPQQWQMKLEHLAALHPGTHGTAARRLHTHRGFAFFVSVSWATAVKSNGPPTKLPNRVRH